MHHARTKYSVPQEFNVQGRQTQLVGCKFGLNTRTKQNLANELFDKYAKES